MKIRPRRLRANELVRSIVRESRLAKECLVQPLFVTDANAGEIKSMPGQHRFDVNKVGGEAKRIFDCGVKAVMLFGIPKKKDPDGNGAYEKNGIVQRAVKGIKKAVPRLMVITDVCLCQYTDHGHCGIVQGGRIANDRTVEVLAKTAVSHIEAGADMVAPSAMMDGQVSAIREALDGAGYQDIPIMSYSSKYASAFYEPFREAAESTPKFGDRKSYQMDTSNVREAMKEINIDIDEGADIVMVKPAIPYLDVIASARRRFDVPLAAYSVSGEYSMVKAAAKNGWLDEKNVVLEMLTAIRRAGADIIITYFAKDAAVWLNGRK